MLKLGVVISIVFMVVSCKVSPCEGTSDGIVCGENCILPGDICCNSSNGMYCGDNESCTADEISGADDARYSGDESSRGLNCVSTLGTGGSGGTWGSSQCRANADTGTCLVLENECSNGIQGACSCAAACVDAVCGDADPGAEKANGDQARSDGYACPY